MGGGGLVCCSQAQYMPEYRALDMYDIDFDCQSPGASKLVDGNIEGGGSEVTFDNTECFKYEKADERVQWPNTNKLLLDPDIGTIWLNLYVDQRPPDTGISAIMEFSVDSNNWIALFLRYSRNGLAAIEQGGTTEWINTPSNWPLDQWFWFGYAWDIENDKHSIAIGDWDDGNSKQETGRNFNSWSSTPNLLMAGNYRLQGKTFDAYVAQVMTSKEYRCPIIGTWDGGVL